MIVVYLINIILISGGTGVMSLQHKGRFEARRTYLAGCGPIVDFGKLFIC